MSLSFNIGFQQNLYNNSRLNIDLNFNSPQGYFNAGGSSFGSDYDSPLSALNDFSSSGGGNIFGLEFNSQREPLQLNGFQNNGYYGDPYSSGGSYDMPFLPPLPGTLSGNSGGYNVNQFPIPQNQQFMNEAQTFAPYGQDPYSQGNQCCQPQNMGMMPMMMMMMQMMLMMMMQMMGASNPQQQQQQQQYQQQCQQQQQWMQQQQQQNMLMQMMLMMMMMMMRMMGMDPQQQQNPYGTQGNSGAYASAGPNGAYASAGGSQAYAGPNGAYASSGSNGTRGSNNSGYVGQSNQPNAPVNSQGLASPVSGGRVTSNFGMRKHPISGQYKMHSGIDIAAPGGTRVNSMKPGKVVFAGNNGGYGNMVIVDHGNGLTTRYAHLSSINVRNGDSVNAGQKLGGVGSTGNSTGNHLHFEVRENGNAVDPRKYINP